MVGVDSDSTAVARSAVLVLQVTSFEAIVNHELMDRICASIMVNRNCERTGSDDVDSQKNPPASLLQCNLL